MLEVTTPSEDATQRASNLPDLAEEGSAEGERISVTDGKKDPTFGVAGTAVIEPAGAANGFDVTLFAAAVQSDGRILVAGNRSNAGAVLYRLWP